MSEQNMKNPGAPSQGATGAVEFTLDRPNDSTTRPVVKGFDPAEVLA